ncbi:MAG: phosphoribosyl transferase [Candidatus Saccharibacteria bacterium]|nr:phosphoribosyl transferase [Candidatus Saccharibacteria bacterium]
MRFRNRREAGRLLAKALDEYKGKQTVVYALPRGGVVLGVEIAKHLHAPLDLIIPRKIGHPLYPEYAICAVTEGGHPVCNEEEVSRHDPKWFDQALKEARAEAVRRRLLYLEGRPAVPLHGKTAIIVDDGVATGLTMLAAIQEAKDRGATEIVVAVPVLPAEVARELQGHADKIVALEVADNYLGAVGSYYDEFEQVSDEEVIELLNSMRRDHGSNRTNEGKTN